MSATTIDEAVEGRPDEVAQPPASWQKFETEELELWLPDSYVGGDPRHDLRKIVEQAPQLGPLYAYLSQQVASADSEEKWRHRWAKQWTKSAKTRQGDVELFFRAFDSAVESWAHHDRFPQTHVLREKLRLTRRGTTLDAYMKAAQAQVSGAIIEYSLVQLGPYEAGRLVDEMAEKTHHGSTRPGMRTIRYAIKGTKAVWILSYSASLDDWARLLPVFEQSAATLRLTDVPSGVVGRFARGFAEGFAEGRREAR